MNLTFQLIDPAGEALLLVHTPVPREAYADLTRRLLAIRELAPRQVAFLTAPTQGGVVRVEAAAAVCGGEVLRQTWPLRQPGGSLEVTTVTQGRQLKRLSVAGPVDLGPVYTVEF